MPARVDRTTSYRRYSEDQVATVGRIALLRRAGATLGTFAAAFLAVAFAQTALVVSSRGCRPRRWPW